MPLWGTTTAAGDKPKFLPVDKNATGSTGSREHAIAVAGGWGLSPGIAASGNDNKDAQPEVLVCVKNLATFMGSASIIGVDWTDATVTDTGTFDITVTFDEAVDITSASWTANQTVTNKAYILLSRLGKTDMVEDSTVACQYYSGDGSNQLVFRGTVQTNAATGYLGFNSSGVGDDDVVTGIIFNGSAALDDEDGGSAIGIRKEAGTAAAGTAGDKIIANGSSGAVLTTNGAVSASKTVTCDTVSGTIAVNQVVTVQDVDTLAISDADSATGISTDNSLTIAAVASQTSFTLSEAVTIADNVILLAMADGGGEITANALSFAVAGPTFASRSDITTITRTGMDDSVAIDLEAGTAPDGGRLVVNASDGSASNADSPIVVEESLNDAATYSASGSSSGTAYILKGVDVAAA